MTRLTRAGAACVAGLASFVLTGSLYAGPLGVFGSAHGGGQGGCATGNCGASQGCATGNCQGPRENCPPPYTHVFEGPPRLKFKRGCARPVCNPCEIPHFGYFQTCWSPWPYGPDWKHCPYPTASDMLPPPQHPPYTPRLNAERPPAPVRPFYTKPAPTEDSGDNNLTPKTGNPPKKELLPPPGKQEKDRSDLSHNPATVAPTAPQTTPVNFTPPTAPTVNTPQTLPPLSSTSQPSTGISHSQPTGSGGVRLIR